MYTLRGYGGNHFSMFAGSRSDFIITNHPEFNLGRVASEKGMGPGWDITKTPCKSGTSREMRQLQASRRASSPRLRGPRQHGMTLKERALARSSSSPSFASRTMPSFESPAMEANDSLSRAMKEFAVSSAKSQATLGVPSHDYASFQRPRGVGKWNYAVPEQAAPIFEGFHGPQFLNKSL
eukprot:TRINITY_DN25055_c0_g1_i1.p1 TRINITY_DN25055_c0_g1~~TRINITY_DN25055_c0_g1_i1.p1  ORF type:complete len:180 (+),score=26.05 TRINITY_DN25055_c0_g1_i1:46-585(+)